MTRGLALSTYRSLLVRLAGGAGPAPFNPLTELSWLAAFWASDPGWSAPADGAGVASWRDGSGNGRTAVAGATQPVYRAASVDMNGRPAVEFAAPVNHSLNFNMPALAQPFSIVSVFMAKAGSGNWLNGPGANLQEWITGSLDTFNYFTGVNLGLSRSTTQLLGHVAVHNGASSFAQAGGVVVSGNSGSASMAAGGWSLGSVSGSPVKPTFGFLGVYSGDIRGDSRYGDLIAWIEDSYGVGMS